MLKVIRYFGLVIFILSNVNTSCKKYSMPSLSTTDATDINITSAVLGGTIIDEGSGVIIAKGVCWSTSSDPTVDDNIISSSSNEITFSVTIEGLEANKQYYVRAYATNEAGTGYGNQVMFTTNQIESWMMKPYFALPAGGIALIAGQQVTIYGDALINVPIQNNLEITYTCDIGRQSANNFIINPVNQDIGNHSLTILFKDSGFTVASKTITLSVYGLSPPCSKKILMIGNSLLASGNDIFHAQLDEVLSNCNLTFLGTQGTTTRHEGHSGWSYQSFVTGISPFIKDGALNLGNYFISNSIDVPDIVFMRLGVNACYGCSQISLTEESKNDLLTRETGYAKQLIDAFLAYNENIKIIVGLSTLCENTGAGWNNNYDESVMSQDLYIEWTHRFWNLLISNFDSGVYNNRVSISSEAIFLDRDEGYPKVSGMHVNGVHPDQSGYEQLGIGMACALNKLLSPK